MFTNDLNQLFAFVLTQTNSGRFCTTKCFTHSSAEACKVNKNIATIINVYIRANMGQSYSVNIRSAINCTDQLKEKQVQFDSVIKL